MSFSTSAPGLHERVSKDVQEYKERSPQELRKSAADPRRIVLAHRGVPMVSHWRRREGQSHRLFSALTRLAIKLDRDAVSTTPAESSAVLIADLSSEVPVAHTHISCDVAAGSETGVQSPLAARRVMSV